MDYIKLFTLLLCVFLSVATFFVTYILFNKEFKLKDNVWRIDEDKLSFKYEWFYLNGKEYKFNINSKSKPFNNEHNTNYINRIKRQELNNKSKYNWC